jgi:hypothetical protein
VTTDEIQRQRTKALRKGNRVRLAQAGFRRDLRELDYSEGCAQAAEVLERKRVPRYIAAMKVDYLLGSVNRMGPANLDATYRRSSLYRRSPNLRIEQLTEGERTRLACALRSRCVEPKEKIAA